MTDNEPEDDTDDVDEQDASKEVSATAEEIEEWNEEHDEPHPVFRVDHRPERQPLEFDDSDEDTPDKSP